MKKIVEEYRKQIKYFLSNKIYFISIIVIGILSYGFAITNYSVGVDDLCFDRYIKGTYILSAKRWGTWGLYNILQINEFSPFWLDTITAIFMIIIAIVLCAFIRKQYGDKIKIWGYIVFSGLLISNPLINQFFIYQSTNLAVVLSNLIVIICNIITYENYFSENKKKINIIIGLILTVPIAMYESCAQTYLVILFVTMFIEVIKNKEKNKKIFKYFCLSIGMLILGMLVYFISGKILLIILQRLNLLKENFAFSTILWLNEDFISLPWILKKIIIKDYLLINIDYFPVGLAVVLSCAAMTMEFIKSVITKRFSRFIITLGIIFSNYTLIIILVRVLFRMQFSWIVTTAFLGMYIYIYLCDGKFIGYVVKFSAILILVFQTRLLNQYFYNDYKRYEKEKVIANDIGLSVMKNTDYKNKPILCVSVTKSANRYKINSDNGVSVLMWGTNAFKEYQIEATKFINEQGYDFLYPTKEQVEKFYSENKIKAEDIKDNYIIELEDIIVINLDVYGL